MAYLSRTLIIFVLLAASGHCADDACTLRGTVVFDGRIPRWRTYEKLAEREQVECECTEVPSERLVLDPDIRALKWVIVRLYVKAADSPPNPLAMPSVSFANCRATPHILIVAPGSDVLIQASNRAADNFHSTPYDFLNPAVNVAIPAGQTYVVKGKYTREPEIIGFNSDIHRVIRGFIVVHDPRYCAVTGADGKFEFKHIPPGKYKLNLFQESCGYREINVELAPGANIDLGAVEMWRSNRPTIGLHGAQVLTLFGVLVLLPALASFIFKKRPGRRFSFSLAWLLVFTVGFAGTIGGGIRWKLAAEQLEQQIREDDDPAD